MASAMKFDVPLLNEKGNFTIWQCTIKDLLMQQGLDAVSEEEKVEEMKDSDHGSLIRGKLQVLLEVSSCFHNQIHSV